MDDKPEKMKSRHNQRIAAVEILYGMDLRGDDEFIPTDDDFTNELVAGVTKYRTTIDGHIESQLERWTLKRVSYVDRAILRVATYEMYGLNTPGEIAINEALELTRRFTDEGDNKSVRFNNAVLDKIKKSLKK